MQVHTIIRMKTKPEPNFKIYADMDFSKAKSVKEIPTLAKLQATQEPISSLLGVFKGQSSVVVRDKDRI